MTDPNTPDPAVPHVPEVPQVPDVPHVPDVPQVPDFPQSNAAGPPPGDSGPPAGTPVPPPGPAYQPPAYQTPTSGPAAGYGPPPPRYGSPAPGGAVPAYSGTKQPVLSILAMVAGVVGLLGTPVGFFPIIGGILALILPLAGVVLGFIARGREPNGRGFWLTGIITGFVGIALALLSILLWALLFANAPMNDFNYNYDY